MLGGLARRAGRAVGEQLGCCASAPAAAAASVAATAASTSSPAAPTTSSCRSSTAHPGTRGMHTVFEPQAPHAWPVRITSTSPVEHFLPGDILELVNHGKVTTLPASHVNVEYSRDPANPRPIAWWVVLPSQQRARSLTQHRWHHLGCCDISVEGISVNVWRDMRANQQPALWRSRGRSVALEGVPLTASAREVADFFDGYSLQPDSIVSVAQDQQAGTQRVMVALGSTSEARRAERSLHSAKLKGQAVRVRVMP